jgi:hypothetical protein
MKQPTWVVFVLAGLAGGCELVAGIQDKYLATTDTGGLVGPSDTGVPPTDDSDVVTDAGTIRPPDATQPQGVDAPTSMSDAPTSIDDAPTDAGTPPAPDAMDAGSNAYTPPDAGTTDPSAPCSKQSGYLFCDDFDSVAMVKDTWTWGIFTVDGGSTAFTSTAYTSPSRSMQVISPVVPPPSVELLGLDLGSLSAQIRLAFDLRLEMDSLTGLPTTAIAQILGGSKIELDYQLRAGAGAMLQCFVSQDGGPTINIPLPAPPLRQWTRIVIAYDMSAGVKVYEDGVQIGSSTAAAAGVPNDTKIQVGMIYQNGAGSTVLQMEMDNVVISGH